MGKGFIYASDVATAGLQVVNELITPRDVSTLLDTFMQIKGNSGINILNIEEVYTDQQGFYYFSIGNMRGTFDFLDFLNKVYKGDVYITSANMGLLFPARMSRGVRDAPAASRARENSAGHGNYYDNGGVNKEASGFLDSARNQKITIPSFYTRTQGYIVGRARNNIKYTVPSPDSMIGRQHCSFYYENGRLTVEDLNSNNGTYVNNQRIQRGMSRVLNVGDVVRLVDYELRII